MAIQWLVVICNDPREGDIHWGPFDAIATAKKWGNKGVERGDFEAFKVMPVFKPI